MYLKGNIFVIAGIVTLFLIQVQGADNYTDGNRLYEFGFTIDGEQHRHEKKDEKGLIEGEFGFITADGVYHVTVYATDEQGRFKILSMKNIRVKPYPTYMAKTSNNSARQGHSLDLPALSQEPVPIPAVSSTLKPISIERPAKSCSHCSLPTTSTQAPVIPTFNQPNINNVNQVGNVEGPKFSQGVKPQSSFDSQPGATPTLQQGFEKRIPQQAGVQYPTKLQNNFGGSQPTLEQGLQPPQNSQSFPQQGFESGQSVPNSIQNVNSGNPLQPSRIPAFPRQQTQTSDNYPAAPGNTYNNNDEQNFPSNPQVVNSGQYSGETPNVGSGRTPKRLNGETPFGSVGTPFNSLQQGLSGQGSPLTKPTLISAQMQIVDKNTDIYRRGPGENEGLPDGLTKDDMTHLLYTFNYTVGFHGHFEEGYTNGVKQGYYFVTGRNGVRTRVDYVADSKGFRPKITQEVLDLLSDDVPKPETEKEAKYGLKGYEFKWLYYPVEAKGR